ncbi:hypothetical protein ACFC5Z_22245 [Streptomyces sp. NPDC056004]|uniref:hypothetical protein n=1 Tax=unclassified Streptomyces TaxID=2593676 RepID=UPI0035E14181
MPTSETDALWQVLVALRRTRDGEPDAAALGELLREACLARRGHRSAVWNESSVMRGGCEVSG